MRRALLHVVGASAAVFLLSSAPGREWRIIGPGGGGAQFYPAISPHDSKRVLVACDMTGSYLSQDAGASWRMFNLGGTTRFFEWDPNDPKVVYAANIGLFRSGDGGNTWHLIYPAEPQVSAYDMGDDHADTSILVGGKPADRLAALAIQPGDSKKLYAGTGRTLRISDDGGASWRTEREFPTQVRRVWATRGALYAAVERSIWVRENGTWREGPAMPAAWTDISAGPPVIYAVSSETGAVSEDAGNTWRRFELLGTGAKLQAIAASRNHPDTAYVSYSQLKADDKEWFGVAKTIDRGRTWTLVWKEANQPADNIHDAWITARFGPGWGENPLSLAAGPDDPSLCYGTDLGRTLKTTDSGKTWNAVYSKRSGTGWTSTGLDVTTNYGVHFDPFDARRIFITYTDIGAFRSEDGGASWVSTTEGVPRSWVNTTYWMVFDPEVRGRVWAVASGTHDLPRPKMWRRTGVSRYRGGVIQSEDGGKTWRKSSEGMPEAAATHILLDPKSPKEKRTLYVTAFGRGVYKSMDGGATWALKNDGIAGAESFAWRLAQDSNGRLYVVVARRSEDGSIGNENDGALYVSSDGAEHWSRMKLPEGVNGPNSLTADPRDTKRLYLAAWRRRGTEPKAGGGIYLSTDAGLTWRNVLDKDQHVYDVTVDPRTPRTLYACGFESSAWRSADAGEHWEKIKGYDFKWGHRVIPDPADPKMIYITTFGGSVWHGPAE
ncbi:MAG TPA: hypothetical protein VGZ73_13070 [Bryobacteraceae bacterium]|jgi:photosystem II stability/assembly factor-like uncharacterized protein|nr:hypothetical protein [Bryobacteraceae bacterium]